MPSDFTRREFLKGAGVLLAGSYYGLRIEPGFAATTAPQLHGYPRVFAFRQAEILANIRSYSDWEKTFLPFDGLIAKMLQEERTDTVTAANLAYVTRFKAAYPGKFAILHLNGRARLPTFETAGWFAGWWLYRAGALTNKPAGPTTDLVQVSDLTPFQLETDNFGGTWADLVITAIGADGKPDFSVAEHVRLLATDPQSSTLQIRRGRYGTPARAWPAGSYIAPHVTAGPWFRGGNKVWFYNFSTSSPRDAAGRHVIDAIIAGLQARFASGGDLAILDGMELDVFQYPLAQRANVDADGDGIADLAMSGVVDLYSIGLTKFTGQLRAMIGPDRLLIVDGSTGQRPDLDNVNGVECEGIPDLHDVDQQKWSQALAMLTFASRTTLPTKLSYGLYKFNPNLSPPKSFSRFRLGLAASLFTSNVLSFYDEPVPGSTTGLGPGPYAGIFPNSFTVWDEVQGGAGIMRPGWLGQPLKATVHLAESLPDLYGGAGVNLTSAFIRGISRAGVTITEKSDPGGPFLLLTSSSDIDLRLPPVSITGSDLTLIIDINADTLPEFPTNAPRFVFASVCVGNIQTTEQRLPVDNRWSHLIVAFRRISGGPASVRIRAERGIAVRLRRIKAIDAPDLAFREFRNGAIFANPSDLPGAFDLGANLPGRLFRRIRGSADQDAAVNNGQPASGLLVLPPIDALLLARSDVFP